MTHTQVRESIRNHFEQFVNKKKVDTGHVNFAPEFVDHGGDVPAGMRPGPAGRFKTCCAVGLPVAVFNV
jgi:hypothetical protein